MLDLAPHPDAVIVPESLLRALTQLRVLLGGALAVISGRTLAEIDRLLPLDLTAAGTHGACWRTPHAATDCVLPLPAPLRAALKEQFPALLVEDKGHAVAVHYRQAPAERPAILAQIHRIIAAAGIPLKLIDGKAVFEIMAPNIDKGTALKRFHASAPFAGRRPIFIGDDTTDEPAIAAALELGGIGLRVGPTTGLTPALIRDWLSEQAQAAA